jgi:predicted transposase YbfD/YdcC
MDGSSANGSDGVRGSGVRKKSSGFRERGNAQAAQSVAGGHWEIENCVFWVLDMTYQEDRSHARKIGGLLHTIRCMAINVIRR